MPNQWETALLCNDVTHWLGANLESALYFFMQHTLLDIHQLLLWPPGTCDVTTTAQKTTIRGAYFMSYIVYWKIVLMNIQYTVLCHYNTVNFLHNNHIAHPLGSVMGCISWVTIVILCVLSCYNGLHYHCYDVIMGAMASQITSLTIVCSIVYWGTDERKHQSSAPLAFVWGIHRWPVNSPHKGPVMRKMFPFDDVIM